MIKTTFLTASLVCLTMAATAQTTQGKRASTTTATQETLATSEVKVDQEYALETAKLQKGFISGEIPKDFPKYDQKASAEENKKTGISYLANHKDLLTQEALDWLKKKGH